MARRKKRKKHSHGEDYLKKGPEIFNPLKVDISHLKEVDKPVDKVQNAQEQPKYGQAQDENLYFLEALSDVKALDGGKKRITRLPDPDIKPAHAPGNDELESLAHLSDLVSGHGELDITFTDEYIEGSVAGLSRKLMKHLKKGMFPIQDYMDLHGLSKQDAEVKVHDFLLQSYRRGLRCVLIVHGRGLNSENHIPVLKERLPAWLKRSPINRIVLAFSTARPYDGGAGAVYVLLRQFHK